MEFVLKSTANAMREHGIKWRSRTILDFKYADKFTVLYENVDKINERFEGSLYKKRFES